MVDKIEKKCQFCSTKKFEKWEGDSGLTGTRCKNKCFGSYKIYTESFSKSILEEI